MILLHRDERTTFVFPPLVILAVKSSSCV